jgi:hypothetical protein
MNLNSNITSLLPHSGQLKNKVICRSAYSHTAIVQPAWLVVFSCCITNIKTHNPVEIDGFSAPASCYFFWRCHLTRAQFMRWVSQCGTPSTPQTQPRTPFFSSFSRAGHSRVSGRRPVQLRSLPSCRIEGPRVRRERRRSEVRRRAWEPAWPLSLTLNGLSSLLFVVRLLQLPA